MTVEDWTTFIFVSSISWLIVPTLAAFAQWDDLTRVENQAGMAIERKEFTPSMARKVVFRYLWVSIATILWPFSFAATVLFGVFLLLRAGLNVLILAMRRS